MLIVFSVPSYLNSDLVTKLMRDPMNGIDMVDAGWYSMFRAGSDISLIVGTVKLLLFVTTEEKELVLNLVV